MSGTVECPNCDAPLPATGGCRRCDWTPTPIPTPAAWEATRCARCRGSAPSTSEFHPGDESADPHDCGVRLCPVCWIPALKRRAARDPLRDGDRARLMRDLRAHLATIDARTRPILVAPRVAA